MLWVLWDIFLPLLVAFLGGLLVGWLFWRWRRSRVDAETLSALRRNAVRLKNDADNLRARNAELSDRLQTASGPAAKGAMARAGVSGGQATRDDRASNELIIAKKRLETLSAELKNSRLEVNRLRDGGSAPGDSSQGSQQANRVRDLEARLQGANRRIADLEQASRETSSTTSHTVSNTTDVDEAIAVRDRMIETLKKSLSQYGDSKDLTALSADLALRDNKINALESLLDNTNKEVIK